MMTETLKITETLAHGYSSESTQRELSNGYPYDSASERVKRDRSCSNRRELYCICLIKHTVRVEVGKIFCRRDVGNHLFYRTPQ